MCADCRIFFDRSFDGDKEYGSIAMRCARLNAGIGFRNEVARVDASVMTSWRAANLNLTLAPALIVFHRHIITPSHTLTHLTTITHTHEPRGQTQYLYANAIHSYKSALVVKTLSKHNQHIWVYIFHHFIAIVKGDDPNGYRTSLSRSATHILFNLQHYLHFAPSNSSAKGVALMLP